MKNNTLKIKDRVKRIGNKNSSIGTVLSITEEVSASTTQSKENPLLITVQWDNGTISVFSNDGLEIAAG